MSRGHGAIENFVLNTIHGSFNPNFAVVLPVLVKMYAAEHGVPVTPNLRSSFNRAVRQLFYEGQIWCGATTMPTMWVGGKPYANRRVTAVTHPGVDDFGGPESELHQIALEGTRVWLNESSDHLEDQSTTVDPAGRPWSFQLP